MSNVVDKIELLESGQILFKNASNEILLTETNELGLRPHSPDGLVVTRNKQPVAVLVTSLVTRLQIQPAAETAFAGTTQQLMEELATNFFR